MDESTSLPCVESAAPRIPDGPAVSPEPSIICSAMRGPKCELLEMTVGARIGWVIKLTLTAGYGATMRVAVGLKVVLPMVSVTRTV